MIARIENLVVEVPRVVPRHRFVTRQTVAPSPYEHTWELFRIGSGYFSGPKWNAILLEEERHTMAGTRIEIVSEAQRLLDCTFAQLDFLRESNGFPCLLGAALVDLRPHQDAIEKSQQLVCKVSSPHMRSDWLIRVSYLMLEWVKA